jgi:hypothetical protein
VDGTGQLRISLLGTCTASSGGSPLDLGGPRQRAVLAVLVLARGEAVRVERLTESVWGSATVVGSGGERGPELGAQGLRVDAVVVQRLDRQPLAVPEQAERDVPVADALRLHRDRLAQ